jgi:heme/copper-type cytochrome/quinol oxidase subunit 1
MSSFISVSHKLIGVQLTVLAFGGLASAYLESLCMRLELSNPGMSFIYNYDFYNAAITVHGVIQIFGFVQPAIFAGVGNVYVPLSVCAPEVAYARFNCASVIVYAGTLVAIALQLCSEFYAGAGWTLYPPLSTMHVLVASYGVCQQLQALVFMGISSTLTSINFVVTSNVRVNTQQRLVAGVYVQAIITTSILLIGVLPALAIALLLLLSDTFLNTGYFDNTYGGDVLLYRHLFWFFGHPEVYVLILPSFGAVTQAFCMYRGIVVTSPQVRVLGIAAIAVLGLIVWAHHQFTTGRELDTKGYYSAQTRVIAVPTGAKIFNYVLTQVLCVPIS